METENHQTQNRGTEAEVRCPVCGAVAPVCSDSAHQYSSPLARRLIQYLYHRRTCQGCCFSFSRLKLGETIEQWLAPFLEPILPQRRFSVPSSVADQPVHIPSAPAKRTQTRQVVHSPTASAAPQTAKISQHIPFSVDPISRMVRLNLECPIGEGEFGGEMLAAASSLERHLRIAADQIRALVENTPVPESAEIAEPSPGETEEVPEPAIEQIFPPTSGA